MANDVYVEARAGFLNCEIKWNDDTVHKAVVVDLGTYTPDLAVDKFLSDIPAGARIATSAAITGKVRTGGVADADDVAFASVPAGPNVEVLVIVQTTAVGGGAELAVGAQRLVSYVDTATGLPLVPNGGPVNVTWDNGANKIFRL